MRRIIFEAPFVESAMSPAASDAPLSAVDMVSMAAVLDAAAVDIDFVALFASSAVSL